MFQQSGKNLLNRNNFSTSSHNMVNFGPLTAEIDWWVWGTPANFNGFRVLASLLQRRRATEVNQTLQDVWPSSVLIHYIYIFWGRPPFPQIDIIGAMVIVWRARGKIIRSVLCNMMCNNCTQWTAHTYEQD